jgi:hypothetical protein
MASIKRGRFTINSVQEHEPSESDHAEEHSKSRQAFHVKKPSYAESERPRKEDSRYAKHVEVADSDKSIDTDYKADSRSRAESSLLISPSPLKYQEKWTMTSEEQPAPRHTVIDLCLAFQETLGSKFTEMLKVHKEIMFELMSKERSRDEQIRRLTQDLSELHLHNAKLQLENKYLCEMLEKQKD